MGDFIIDEIIKTARKLAEEEDTIVGQAVFAIPTDQMTELNPTTPIGGCSNLYLKLIFQLPKWGYKLAKLDEWMEISPTHVEAYNLTVEQKHKLEAAIKQGLGSAAQAVADYELAKHDLRKYREILDYFKLGKKDEHVLRSLFIDRVDAFTGEGYSMITMAKRWPTIISDFIRMYKIKKEDRDNVNKIADELKVSRAEATILKTKNSLFEEWKMLFFPEVKERYARIKNLVRAREKSIDEYREWLKPYISRYKMMREVTEKTPSKYATDAYMVPGFGSAWAVTGVRLLTWLGFSPPEMGKPERLEIDPYDDYIKRNWVWKIEEKYKVKVYRDKDEFEEINGPKAKLRYNDILADKVAGKYLEKGILYYNLFDINIEKIMAKVPKGGELEDMTLNIQHYLLSQNMLLVYCLELWAKEIAFDRHIKEIIGVKEMEEEIRKEVELEFEPEKRKIERLESLKNITKDLRKIGYKINSEFVFKYLIKPGPYEWDFKDSITRRYCVPIGSRFGKLVKFLLFKMEVPGVEGKY